MSKVRFRSPFCVACHKRFVLGQAFLWVEYFNTGYAGDEYNRMFGVIHAFKECKQIIIDYSIKQNWGNPVDIEG